ncbi:MAG TPA: folate-binding protein [Naasia sp.]|jgi:folate-binding protein YgfZ
MTAASAVHPSPLLALPGAVDGTGRDAGVPAHYGNPLGEQRALAEGHALVQLPRGVVTVTGPDRLSWLDSLTSQRLLGLPVGASAESLLLDPQGRVEHDLRVVDDGETAWLLVERDEAASLSAFLDRMRFMLRVEVADRSSDFAVLGGTAPATAVGTPPAVWSDSWSAIAPGGVGYAAPATHPAADWTWSETIVPVAALGELAALGESGTVRLAGMLAAEALRIAAWRPRLGADTDERTIPHEVDWLRSAVHLAKGCYRGQETVAKVHNLGRPPRRIVMLNVDGSEGIAVPAGAPVVDSAGREVGAVTSSALHYELGPIALAVVKRSAPSDAPLAVLVDGLSVAAAQEVIVPADAGHAVEVPRLPRLGARAR